MSTGYHLNLDHYLRLAGASAPVWLAVLARLTGGRRGQIQVPLGPFSGRLACLESATTRVGVLETAGGFRLEAENAPLHTLVAVLDGQLRHRSSGREQLLDPGSGVFLTPQEHLSLDADGGVRMAVVQWPQPHNHPLSPPMPGPAPRVAVNRLLDYLDRARLFRNHAHALTETLRMGPAVRAAVRQSDAGLEAAGPWRPSGVSDRRVARAIACLRDWRELEFDSQWVAETAGVSTRNLYYLMRRHTGMTPYQFYVSQRLIRVREGLLSCTCDMPTVSWHAMSEGFCHLGRFAALYRGHFGEYPSETLQWRDRALAWASQVQPLAVAGAESAFRLDLG